MSDESVNPALDQNHDHYKKKFIIPTHIAAVKLYLALAACSMSTVHVIVLIVQFGAADNKTGTDENDRLFQTSATRRHDCR